MQLFAFFDFMNIMLFIIKFIMFKSIIKFKKFQLHTYLINLVHVRLH